MDVNQRIEAFQDTMQMFMSPALQAQTQQAAASSVVYFENFRAPQRTEQLHADIIVEENTTLAAAKKYLPFGKTAVLNFANPVVPGGGVQNGAVAQEEDLCLRSNLYACLCTENVFGSYYQYHRQRNDNFYSDRLIYTQGVTVFKDEGDIPKPLKQKAWYQVDVITCAAPYLANRRYTNKTVLKGLFQKRIENIFEVAIAHQVEVIILGAFGCGAFMNPSNVVARAFRDAIDKNRYAGQFRKIVFAIKPAGNPDQPDDKPDVFRTELCQNPTSPTELRLHKTFASPTVDAEFRTPSGKRLAYDTGFNQYRVWNPYFGKQFSILGDSISTLAGFHPEGYKTHYVGNICASSGVFHMADTWWGKVIDFFGGELLVNNSWSGSRVTKYPNETRLFPSACSDERTSALHFKDEKPDVILIYIGTNDWGFGAKTHEAAEDENERFDFAYDSMLQKIIKNYPNSEIWCCTLCTTGKVQGDAFGLANVEAYNEIIETAAWKHGCRIIDLYGYHMPYETMDGVHPTVNGMATLANMVIRCIGGQNVKKFLDCENDAHDFAAVSESGEVVTYVCQKCGKMHYAKKTSDTATDASKHILRKDSQAARFSSNTLRLTVDKRTEEYHKDVVTVGRGDTNDFDFGDKTYISRHHATFFHEQDVWFLRDNFSTNGTSVNDIPLLPGRKYQLAEHDVICFSKRERMIPFARKPVQPDTLPYEIAVNYLQSVIAVCGKMMQKNASENVTHDLKTEAFIRNNMISALRVAPLFFPTKVDVKAILESIDDPENLDKNIILQDKDAVKRQLITLTLKDGREIIPAFTSKEELQKKLNTLMIRYDPQDYLPILLRLNKPVVINPFSASHFVLTPYLIQQTLRTLHPTEG